MRFVSAIVAAVLSVGSIRGDDSEKEKKKHAPDIPKLSAQLRSVDQAKRLEALAAIRALPSVPKPMMVPLGEFIRIEARDLIVKGVPQSVAMKAVPIDDGDASLAGIEADPKAYIDKEFFLVGVIRNCGEFSAGYMKSASTHRSIDFMPAARDGKHLESDGIHIYIDRRVAGALTGINGGLPHDSPRDSNAYRAVRLRCTIFSQRIGPLAEAIPSSIEVLDWQTLGKDEKWNPPALRGIKDAIEILRHGSKPGIDEVVRLAVYDSVPGGMYTQMVVGSLAQEVLLQLEGQGRRTALASVMKFSDAPASTAMGPQQVEELIKELGVPVRPKLRPTAASLLASGKALEKAGKKSAALEFYRKVVKEYPDTAPAKDAAARMNGLE